MKKRQDEATYVYFPAVAPPLAEAADGSIVSIAPPTASAAVFSNKDLRLDG